jgi:hypothetical protein
MANTPDIKQKFELRVLLFDGKRYAIYQSSSVNRHDIYTSMGHLDGRNLFRQSYHRSGQSHLHFAGQKLPQKPGEMPDNISGHVQIACTSMTFGPLIRWNYKPKKENRTRRNIIIDIRTLPAPQITAELWAIKPNQPENVSAVLSKFQEHLIIHHEHITHTNPEFVVIIWTLSAEKWISVMQTLRNLPRDDVDR